MQQNEEPFGQDFYTRSRNEIKKIAREKAMALAHGGADGYSDYKHECGVIKGLDMALVVLEDVFKQIAKEDRQ